MMSHAQSFAVAKCLGLDRCSTQIPFTEFTYSSCSSDSDVGNSSAISLSTFFMMSQLERLSVAQLTV